jgi:hypothetical protein
MSSRTLVKATKFGPISRITIPDSWIELADRFRGSQIMREFLSSSVSNATINLFYRGNPISTAAAQNFESMLNKEPIERRDLTDDEKVFLWDLLGPEYAGNNQFTNAFDPVFTVESVYVDSIGSRRVLFVRGRFKSQHEAIEGNEFFGIFAPHGEGGRNIYEVFLQVPGSSAFEQCLPDFERALASIDWLA